MTLKNSAIDLTQWQDKLVLTSLTRVDLLVFEWLVDHCDPSGLKQTLLLVSPDCFAIHAKLTHAALCTGLQVYCPLWYLVNITCFPVCAADVRCGRTEKKGCFFINFNILPESNICDITTLTRIGAFPQCVPCQQSHTHTQTLRCVSLAARWMSGTHTHTLRCRGEF